MLHFDKALSNNRPGGGTQHYIGRTQRQRVTKRDGFERVENGLEARMEEHRAGGASKVTDAFHRAGIGFQIANLFHPVTGQRGFELERALKKQKHASRLCPICLGKEEA